jgi:hypothetical protein
MYPNINESFQTELISERVNVENDGLNKFRGELSELEVTRLLNGGKHLSKEDEAAHSTAQKMLGAEGSRVQLARAKEMVDTYKAHAQALGYGGKIKQVIHTHLGINPKSVPGISRAYDQKENPSDVVVEWEKKPKKMKNGYHGLSLKSSKTKHVTMANPGIDELGKDVGVDLAGMVKKSHSAFAKKENLSDVDSTRDKQLRDSAKGTTDTSLYNRAQEEATKLHKGMRDSLMSKYQEMANSPEGHEQLKQHFFKHFLRTSENNEVPYVKLTGTGGEKTPAGKIKEVATHVEEGDHSPAVQAAKASKKFSFKPTGNKGFDVYAHDDEHPEGRRIFKFDVKHKSYQMGQGVVSKITPVTIDD